MVNTGINNRILFLDYLRVVAFSFVILGHKFSNDLLAMSNDIRSHVTLRLFYGFLYNMSYGGAMGVVIFFLVSGYIITHVLQTESTYEFYLKRIFRIYPLYIFAVLIEIFIGFSHGVPIPSLNVIIPRLFLIGDFFNTPLSIGDVEWTLRIEIIFYGLMGLIKKIGLISNGNFLTMALLALTFTLATLPPLPIANDFHNAYFSIYSPFLFIGVVIYLLEKKLASTSLAVIAIILIFYMHLNMIEKYSHRWSEFNYAIIGLIVFSVFLILRNNLTENKVFTLLSELTYSIYLFHNWIWVILSDIANRIKIPFIPENIKIITMLLLVCYASNKLIERKFVSYGKIITRLIFKRATSNP